MSIFNRRTGRIEETDDTHDLEWWSKEENRALLGEVSFAFHQWDIFQFRLSGGKHLKYDSWRRYVVNAPWVRENFGLLSLPRAGLWRKLQKLLDAG